MLCTILKHKNQPKFGDVADEGFFLGYVPGSPNKRVFNKAKGVVEISFNIEVTSYSTMDSAQEPNWMFDYVVVFKSFNVPHTFNAEPPNDEDIIFDEDDDDTIIPRLIIPITAERDNTDANENSSGNNLSSSQEDISTVVEKPFTNPFGSESSAEAETTGEIGSNLEHDLPVDTVVTTRSNRDHPVDYILGDPSAGIQTRRSFANATCMYARIRDSGVVNKCMKCFISQIEPKTYQLALRDNAWVEAMQEELSQFRKLKVWELVDLPRGAQEIGTRWVFKNKKDDNGIVVRNKARLVVKGFN